jgi:hypothetical protein
MMMRSHSDEWVSGFLQTSPMFEPVREAGKSFEKLDHWPGIECLNQLNTDPIRAIATKSGERIRFVPQARATREFVQRYEPRIYLTGEIQTREHNWHDLFNALVWLTYPRSKAALNQLHYRALLQESVHQKVMRSPLRDAATLLDESGVIVASSNDDLIALLKNFEWKTLFWEQRDAVMEQMKFFLFGHGLYEKALCPYLGMTGKGILFHVNEAFFERGLIDQIAMIDIWLDNFLAREYLTSADLTPVPVLGYPGWSSDNTDSSYYDNQRYFRQRKMKKESRSSNFS